MSKKDKAGSAASRPHTRSYTSPTSFLPNTIISDFGAGRNYRKDAQICRLIILKDTMEAPARSQ